MSTRQLAWGRPASTSVSLSRLEKLGLIEPWFGTRETYFQITIGGKAH